jgi:hypothetical protein
MSIKSPRSSRKSASREIITPKTVNGFGVLRSVLEQARLDAGCSLGDLTALSAQVDPYRLDTPAGHRNGKWLAQQLNKGIGPSRRIHWRGLHYILVSGKSPAAKPDGEIFRNTEGDWLWLSEVAGKAARWLGYIPFGRITDNRNAEPIIHRKARVMPRAVVSIGLDVDVPDADDIEPTPTALGFEPRQAFHFAIFGEKASLEDVVDPIAIEKQADLYLPTGEISDTLVHRIAKDADDDGRPLVLFTLTDCDPAGYQMSVSIARKLQAFRDLLFPDLRFEVVPVALNPEQVEALGLPSTPLKESEKRADRWREAFGIEQTEIDALATLRPEVLREIVERAFDPYVDRGLGRRVALAKTEWEQQAADALREQIDQTRLEALRTEAAGRLAELEDVISDINARLQMAADDHFTLPLIEVPQPEVNQDIPRQALVSLDQDWAEATRALIKRKTYGEAAP